jgi:hypothetical protein
MTPKGPRWRVAAAIVMLVALQLHGGAEAAALKLADPSLQTKGGHEDLHLNELRAETDRADQDYFDYVAMMQHQDPEESNAELQRLWWQMHQTSRSLSSERGEKAQPVSAAELLQRRLEEEHLKETAASISKPGPTLELLMKATEAERRQEQERERLEHPTLSAREAEKLLQRPWFSTDKQGIQLPKDNDRPPFLPPNLNPQFVVPPFAGATNAEGMRRRLQAKMPLIQKTRAAQLEARRAAVEAVRAAVDEGVVKTPSEISAFADMSERRFMEDALRRLQQEVIPLGKPIADPGLLAVAGAANDAADTARAFEAEERAMMVHALTSQQQQAQARGLSDIPLLSSAAASRMQAAAASVDDEDAAVLPSLLEQHCGIDRDELVRRLQESKTSGRSLEGKQKGGVVTTLISDCIKKHQGDGEAGILKAWQQHRRDKLRRLAEQTGEPLPFSEDDYDESKAQRATPASVSLDKKAWQRKSKFDPRGVGVFAEDEKQPGQAQGDAPRFAGRRLLPAKHQEIHPGDYRRSLASLSPSEREEHEALMRRLEGHPPEDAAEVMRTHSSSIFELQQGRVDEGAGAATRKNRRRGA